jgi:hypothetical protein
MSMQAESLEVLEKANLPSVQARAIVRAIEIEIAGAKDVLATKYDIVVFRGDVRQEITLLRSEMAELATTLRSEMSELATSLRSEMSELATSLRGEMSELATSLRGEMSELATSLRSEMAELRTELRAEFRTEISAAKSSIVRQMYGAILGQMAVLLGIAYFFVTQIANG